MAITRMAGVRVTILGVSAFALAACGSDMDWDLRRADGMLGTTAAAQQATVSRPRPDERGVISYPNYQVAVARRGDTVADLAGRVGIGSGELARYNGLAPDDPLRPGEVVALPRRVGAAGGTDAQPDGIDITSLASGAIDRAEGTAPASAPPPAPEDRADRVDGPEPVRHQVVRGETAFSISRLYGVSPRALADWNGLGPDLEVREGQYLMIPVTRAEARAEGQDVAAAEPEVSAPGSSSPTPPPPSASTPLPEDDAPPASEPDPAEPERPDLSESRSSQAQFAMPVDGSIIREFEKGSNDGIDIAAPAGAPVRAAGDGTVAAVTRNTDNVTIMVIRHSGELLSVYANIDAPSVAQGDSVSRGQTIGEVRAGDPAFLHFEIRRGLDSVDPLPLLR